MLKRTRKAKIIGVLHSKGGIGKSTVTFNLAEALARLGCETGLIDFDRQGTQTEKFQNRYEKDKERKESFEAAPSIGDLLLAGKKLQKKDFYKADNGVYVIGNSNEINGDFFLRKELSENKYKALKIIASDIDFLDYILIDTVGTQDVQFFNVLSAADYILIPTICKSESKVPLIELIETIKEYQQDKEKNPNLKLLGVVLNIIDKRHTSTNSDFETFLADVLPCTKLQTTIGVDNSFSRLHELGLSVFDGSVLKRAEDYSNLAKEIKVKTNQ